jgi:hypothetical protein
MKLLCLSPFLLLAAVSANQYEPEIRGLKGSGSKGSGSKSKSKSGSKKSGGPTKFCYRDTAVADVMTSLPDQADPPEDKDSAAILVDLGTVHINSDMEAILVEATVSTLMTFNMYVDDSDSNDNEWDWKAGMKGALFPGCTSNADCLAKNVSPIDPFPSAEIPIKIENLLIDREDDDWDFEYSSSQEETTTAKFFWPSGSLDEGDYYLALSFYINSRIKYYDDTSYVSMQGKVELGPHLISVEKIKAVDEFCDFDVVDDDAAADALFGF